MNQSTSLRQSFQFDPFSVKSLLVQAVEHVLMHVQHDAITSEFLIKISRELNDLVQIGVEPYDSPPGYPYDFDFRFNAIRDEGDLRARRLILQVINKAGEVVLEWEN